MIWCTEIDRFFYPTSKLQNSASNLKMKVKTASQSSPTISIQFLINLIFLWYRNKHLFICTLNFISSLFNLIKKMRRNYKIAHIMILQKNKQIKIVYKQRYTALIRTKWIKLINIFLISLVWAVSFPQTHKQKKNTSSHNFNHFLSFSNENVTS